MELCIDTSTRYASVAVSEEGHIVAELSWQSNRNHSVELVPAMRRVVEHSGTEMNDARAIFVAGGPGGFSALRVSLSVAKSLAMARGIPLIAINTLDIEALPFLNIGRPVSAVIGAGRTRVYLATYDSGLLSENQYRVVDREQLADRLRDDTLLCGEEAATVASLVGPGVTVPAIPRPTRRPSVLARLGYEQLQQGRTDDPDTLQPIYMQSAQFKKAEQARRQRIK